jgi:hypothetical protein
MWFPTFVSMDVYWCSRALKTSVATQSYNQRNMTRYECYFTLSKQLEDSKCVYWLGLLDLPTVLDSIEKRLLRSPTQH